MKEHDCEQEEEDFTLYCFGTTLEMWVEDNSGDFPSAYFNVKFCPICGKKADKNSCQKNVDQNSRQKEEK